MASGDGNSGKQSELCTFRYHEVGERRMGLRLTMAGGRSDKVGLFLKWRDTVIPGQSEESNTCHLEKNQEEPIIKKGRLAGVLTRADGGHCSR